MKLLREYDIDIAKLNPGQYNYSFRVEDTFFELFENSLVDHGSLTAEVLLEKKISFISLDFKISGTVELTCDRSLDLFDYYLTTYNEIVLKFGEEARELSDEMEMIPFDTKQINVAQYLYEFISVAVPMKKLHPRYQDESDEDQLFFSSEEPDEDIEKNEDAEIDPRWNALKKLKNK